MSGQASPAGTRGETGSARPQAGGEKIKQKGVADNNLRRSTFGGWVLVLLCAVLVVAIYQKSEAVTGIIAAISGGLGFLLGERSRSPE